MSDAMVILDGPVGTELNARGVRTELPLWSAAANETHPEVVSAIHRDYAGAGATVHTTNTFRTRRRLMPGRWRELTTRAVELARGAVPRSHRVAGSIAPLEDCYRPDLSPPDAYFEHREMADALAEAGCDVLLCETFPHPVEATVAVSAAIETGVETWLSITAGPFGDLLEPLEVQSIARRAADAGASAILINCVSAPLSLPYYRALAGCSVATGVYANAGAPDDRIGWQSAEAEPSRYLEAARGWVRAGATIIGGCCGTGPEHVRLLAAEFGPRSPSDA